jgi:hypothetical protein
MMKIVDGQVKQAKDFAKELSLLSKRSRSPAASRFSDLTKKLNTVGVQRAC